MKAKGLLIFAAVLLTGCSSGEAQQLTQPYDVATARHAQPTPDAPESPEFEVAEAVVEIPVEEVEAVTEPEKVAEEPKVASLSKGTTFEIEEATIEVEEVEEEVIEDSCFEGEVETGNYYEDIPDETSQVWEQPSSDGMQYAGDWYVTFYSADLMGNSGSANGYGSIPWATCACGYDIPFGTLVYVGDPVNMTFEVRDRGVPSGCLDIFVSTYGEIPSWGGAYIPCYIVAWGDGRTAWG